MPALLGTQLRAAPREQQADPLERVNLVHPGHKRTAAQDRDYKRLQHKLAHVEQTRLQPLA